jgi:hypothetical protein
MLIAHLKAHLVSGETVELLPVRHETDVKKELTALLEGWASSGFLIWEKFVYPWHQVKTIEVKVENLRMNNPRKGCWTCMAPIVHGCTRSSGRAHARFKQT